MSKRNLHLERIYHNSPELLKILEELGVMIDPVLHKSPLRRFIFGEKHEPIEVPIRREMVTRDKMVTVHMDIRSDIDTFFSIFRKNVEDKISESGIPVEDVTAIELCQDFEFGVNEVCVSYPELETDIEFEARSNRAKKFNEILSFKDEIYRRIDLLEGETVHVSIR